MSAPAPDKASRSSNPLGSSALAREVHRLKPFQRSTLGIPDEAVLLWDAIVSCAAVLIDDSDGRPWAERLTPLMNRLFISDTAVDTEKLEQLSNYVGKFAKEDLPKWAKDLQRDGPVRFLLRMLGAATFRRCALALQSDGAVLAIAIRRATRNILPYAAALDDIYAYVPEKSFAKLPGLTGTPSAVVLLAIKLDEFFGEKVRSWGLPLALATTNGAEQVDLSAEDLPALVETLREFTANRSRVAAADLSATLDRKMRGARDAIRYSADPVGQAATSLIELLDRILRAAFPDDFVLAWVERNYESLRSELSYVPGNSKDGARRPTKRAQALCFAHAGADIDTPSPLHELAAEAIAAIRDGLQKLKHSDRGTPEEMEELGRLLASVEGFMTLVVGVMWNSASEQVLNEFRTRLDPQSRT